MDKIKTLLSRLKLFCEVELALSEKLEEHDRRLYPLEQDNKLYKGSLRQLEKEVMELKLVIGRLKREENIISSGSGSDSVSHSSGQRRG